jgi:hypothetical protein
MTDDIFAEMEADAVDATVIPTDEKLEGVAGLVQRHLSLEKSIKETDEALKNLKRDLDFLQTRTLPEALTDIGLTSVSLKTGERVEIKPFVGAHILKAKKEEAHTWLRENGHGDLIKVITKVDTGRDLESTASVQKVLSGMGLVPSTDESVHNGTLRVWVREQVEAGVPIPLELFGAFLGQKSTITKG